MKSKPKATGQVGSREPDEPTFRYSLELVATISAHFVDGNTSDMAASERAIKLLDAVSETIRRKEIWLRARTKAGRLSEETPKHLKFAKGLQWLFGRGSETKNIEPFRSYLRLNIRLNDLGRPSELTEAEVSALLAPLPDGPEREEENARIQIIEKRYRDTDFNQVDLIQIKEESDWLNSRLVRPFVNSNKGKKGGRSRGSKKNPKKILGAKIGGQ